MAGENKIPTREECLRCVRENRGKFNEAGKDLAEDMIAKLAEECGKARKECALAQATLEKRGAVNPEVGQDPDIE